MAVDIPLTLILAESNSDDRLLVSEEIHLVSHDIEIIEIKDGQELLHFMESIEHELIDSITPPYALIISSNLIKLDALQILNALSQNTYFDTLPIMVMTLSDHDEKRYANLINPHTTYQQKPVENLAIQEFLTRILSFRKTIPPIREFASKPLFTSSFQAENQ